jgi:hypothetical protein
MLPLATEALSHGGKDNFKLKFEISDGCKTEIPGRKDLDAI